MHDYPPLDLLQRNMSWRALNSPQRLVAGRRNVVTIEREVVPIVFIPGIMGTRLTGRAGMVWDPDDGRRFATDFALRYATLQKRLDVLVGPGGEHQPHHLWLPESGVQYTQEGSFKNLVQTSYKQVFAGLTQCRQSSAIQLCLHMPVYAFAYNWTQSPIDSGQALANFIRRIILQHQSAQNCRKVLLVSHSMGGIVARSAMHLHGMAEHVVGAVHVCMPMAGAPIVYLQSKIGFAPPKLQSQSLALGAKQFFADTLFAALMGPTGLGVARVLSHLPGALSLLPSCHYRTCANSAKWLNVSFADAAVDTQHRTHLNHDMDPFEHIYRQQKGPIRLFTVPPMCVHKQLPCIDSACWQRAQRLMDDVELLHRRLGVWCHPNTHHIVGQGRATHDRVTWLATVKSKDTFGVTLLGEGLALDGNARGDGDGTVPVSSMLSGVKDQAQVARISGIEHSTAMNEQSVLQEVRRRVAMLAHQYIAQVLAS